MGEQTLLFNQLLPHQRPLQPLPVGDEAETNSQLLLPITFSTLGALVQARGNGGDTSTPHQLLLLDISLLAILLSLASSALHLDLHRQLRLPLARLFLRLAAFFTTAAVVLLITISISPTLRWVPSAVFFSTFLLLVCFKLFPATLHYVAALRRRRFVGFLIGRPAADDDVQSPSNQLSPDEQGRNSAETASELRRVGEFLLAATFSTLGTLIQARENGGTSHQVLLLDVSFLAILLSLASSALHLELHRQLRLPMARLFLRLAAFFTTAAVVFLITISISPSLRWEPSAVFFSTLLSLVFIRLLPVSLRCVATVLRRCRFVQFLIGPAADDDVQSPSNQLSPTPMDGQRGHLHGESETAAPAELQLPIPE